MIIENNSIYSEQNSTNGSAQILMATPTASTAVKRPPLEAHRTRTGPWTGPSAYWAMAEPLRHKENQLESSAASEKLHKAMITIYITMIP